MVHILARSAGKLGMSVEANALKAIAKRARGTPRIGNRLLRREITNLAQELGLEVAFPSPRLCTDNAAMIAAAGAFHLARGDRDDLTMDADPSLRLATSSAAPSPCTRTG